MEYYTIKYYTIKMNDIRCHLLLHSTALNIFNLEKKKKKIWFENILTIQDFAEDYTYI